MSILAFVYALLLLGLFQLGVWVMLAGVVILAGFLIYKNIKAAKLRDL